MEKKAMCHGTRWRKKRQLRTLDLEWTLVAHIRFRCLPLLSRLVSRSPNSRGQINLPIACYTTWRFSIICSIFQSIFVNVLFFHIEKDGSIGCAVFPHFGHFIITIFVFVFHFFILRTFHVDEKILKAKQGRYERNIIYERISRIHIQ